MDTTATGRFFLADTHCHLDLAQFDADRDEVIAHAVQKGVRLLVNPGIDLDHSRRAVALAERYETVYAAVGVHPNSSNGFDEATVDEIRTLAGHPKVVAIGEIGLDYHWNQVTPAEQAVAFRAQLALAAEVGLPVIIHNREADTDTMSTLQSWIEGPEMGRSLLAKRRYWGVLHAFSGDREMAERAYSWNFVLGLGGPVTFKNSRQLHELIPLLRLDRLMLETDAPYLAPHPYRGSRNEPAHVPLICRRVAELAQIAPQVLAHDSTRLALTFFGLETLPDGEESVSSCHVHI